MSYSGENNYSLTASQLTASTSRRTLGYGGSQVNQSQIIRQIQESLLNNTLLPYSRLKALIIEMVRTVRAEAELDFQLMIYIDDFRRKTLPTVPIEPEIVVEPLSNMEIMTATEAFIGKVYVDVEAIYTSTTSVGTIIDGRICQSSQVATENLLDAHLNIIRLVKMSQLMRLSRLRVIQSMIGDLEIKGIIREEGLYFHSPGADSPVTIEENLLNKQPNSAAQTEANDNNSSDDNNNDNGNSEDKASSSQQQIKELESIAPEISTDRNPEMAPEDIFENIDGSLNSRITNYINQEDIEKKQELPFVLENVQNSFNQVLTTANLEGKVEDESNNMVKNIIEIRDYVNSSIDQIEEMAPSKSVAVADQTQASEPNISPQVIQEPSKTNSVEENDNSNGTRADTPVPEQNNEIEEWATGLEQPIQDSPKQTIEEVNHESQISLPPPPVLSQSLAPLPENLSPLVIEDMDLEITAPPPQPTSKRHRSGKKSKAAKNVAEEVESQSDSGKKKSKKDSKNNRNDNSSNDNNSVNIEFNYTDNYNQQQNSMALKSDIAFDFSKLDQTPAVVVGAQETYDSANLFSDMN